MKRPLMWFCILGIGILYILNGLAGYFFPPPDLAGEVSISGRLVKKEYKNDHSILYLKGCEIQFDEDLSEANQSVNSILSKTNQSTEFNLSETNQSENSNLLETNLSENSNLLETNLSTNSNQSKTNQFSKSNPANQSKQSNRGKGIICYLEDSCCMEEYPLYPGAKIRLGGKITRPDSATNPGEFDRRKYYHARGYEYIILGGRIEQVSGGVPFLDCFYRLKEKGGEIILNAMGEEYGGILIAILFGDKNHLSPDTKDLFAEGGISHILAISGLHISLIGTFVYALLNRKPLPEFVTFLLTLFFLLGYGYMVGLAPSVFRAIFMFSYRCFSKIKKKSYDALTAMMLSGLFTCLVYPDMVTDSSFLLSYLACVGIYCVFPCFLPFRNRGGRWWDSIFIGLSVFLTTLPVSILSFHQVSLGGFLLNLYALPSMPVLFTLGFALIFTAGIFPGISSLLALLCKAILFTFSYGAGKLSALPFLLFYVKSPGTLKIVLYTIFVVLFVAAAASFRRKMKLEYYALVNRETDGRGEGADSSFEKEHKAFRLIQGIYYLLVFVTVLLMCLFLLCSPKKSTVTFLDVGQGDGIFIRTGTGDIYMIDGGSTSRKNIGDNILLPYLKYEGEREVDFWMLTHGDKDHISGFEEILSQDAVRIRRLGVPLVLKEDFADLTKEAEEKGIKVIYLEEGDVITGKGEYRFTVVSPNPEEYYADANEASLALLYQEGEFTAAFMGDSGLKAEDALIAAMREPDLDNIKLLKCAHHGSGINANTQKFFERVNPKVCIFSCGADNSYGHPHAVVLERAKAVGSGIFRTDRDGAVVIFVKKKSLRIKKFKKV